MSGAPQAPTARVVVLATYDTDADVLRAVEAIRAAARGETVLTSSLAARLVDRMRRPRPESLFRRFLPHRRRDRPETGPVAVTTRARSGARAVRH